MDDKPTIDLLEGIATARSIRRYRLDEPVSDEDLSKIMWSATRAPSGTNRQPFRFIVLRDGDNARRARAVLAQAFRASWKEKCDAEGWTSGGFDMDSKRGRTLAAMQTFIDNFERIPVIILACFVRFREPNHFEGASVFPACQNLLLAARALGYGCCFSGWHVPVADQLKEILGVPAEVELSLCITLGKPAGNHGPVRRRPVQELIFDDGWEQPATWCVDPPGSRFARGGPPKKS